MFSFEMLLYAFVIFISFLYLLKCVLDKSKEKNNCSVLSNCLSVLILYFNAAKFSIKLFYFIYFTVSLFSKWDKYEIVTETQPFNQLSLPRS